MSKLARFAFMLLKIAVLFCAVLPAPAMQLSSRRATIAASASMVGWATASTPARSMFGNSNNRRQLEVCLVSVQRVVYWAQAISDEFRLAASTEERKKVYLEARLGAKALLTGKMGGGANGRVYQLASFQLPSCLDDLESYATTKEGTRAVNTFRTQFSEGLASIVEFDGLETLIDPSPRSSLTLSQYNDSKATYIRRALSELVVPAGNKLLRSFGPEPLDVSLRYIEQYYSSEIYRPPSAKAY